MTRKTKSLLISQKNVAHAELHAAKREITYADGCYVVNSRRYDEGEIVLELEQGNTQIKGYLWQLMKMTGGFHSQLGQP